MRVMKSTLDIYEVMRKAVTTVVLNNSCLNMFFGIFE